MKHTSKVSAGFVIVGLGFTACDPAPLNHDTTAEAGSTHSSSGKGGASTKSTLSAKLGSGGSSSNVGSQSIGGQSSGSPSSSAGEGGTPSTPSEPAGGTSSDLGGASSTAVVTLGGAASGGAPSLGGTPNAGGSVSRGGSSAQGGASTGGQSTAEAPSCEKLTAQCQTESCCITIRMGGGTFSMGRSTESDASDYYASGDVNELPEHAATVAAFSLDKYEVTVGRFRAFVTNYDVWRRSGKPQGNDGAHPIAANTGWGRAWNATESDLPASAAAMLDTLNCGTSVQNWTDKPESNESYPINCVTWFMAFAFCIWDGGRLPTEAEWEFAAAGGAQNLRYPWGNAEPDQTRANYADSARSPRVAVGSRGSSGEGYFKHQDLAGSLWEWVLDGYDPYFYGTTNAPIACNNCANAADILSGSMVIRGGSWQNGAKYLRSAARAGLYHADIWGSDLGFRCARPAP